MREELIKMIADAFSCENPLGCAHTLAACEYYDEWRWFPEDGDLKIISGRSGANPSFEGWPEEVKNEILSEISQKKITDKKYHFFDVGAKYLYDFCFGVSYLTGKEFKFYLAAWMFNVVNGDIGEEGLINDTFFSSIEKYHQTVITSKTPDYTSEQLEAIANFLLFLKVRAGSFYSDGVKCLGLGWEKHLTKRVN